MDIYIYIIYIANSKINVASCGIWCYVVLSSAKLAIEEKIT